MTINQVSKKYNVPTYTLRYWEKLQIISPIAKDIKGHRVYTSDNINEIKFAILMRNSGMEVKQLIQFMKLLRLNSKSALTNKKLIHQIKSQLHLINQRTKILKDSKKHMECKLRHFSQMDDDDAYHYELKTQKNVKYEKKRD